MYVETHGSVIAKEIYGTHTLINNNFVNRKI